MNIINTLIILSSSFVLCCAPQTNKDNCGAGGVFVYQVTSLSLSNTLFASCFTGSSGAGAYFESVKGSVQSPQTVNHCIFVSCIAEGNSPDGGGLGITNSDYTTKCTNSLFSICKSDNGGGFLIAYAAQPEPYPLRFCFFHNNYATYGTDVCFPYLPSNSPFVHCFSTSDTPRLHYWHLNSTSSKAYNNWLPQGILLITIDSV